MTMAPDLLGLGEVQIHPVEIPHHLTADRQIEVGGKAIGTIDRPEQLPGSGCQRRRAGSLHQRATGSATTRCRAHPKIDHDLDPDSLVDIIVGCHQQIAKGLAIAFSQEAAKGRIRPKTIAEVALRRKIVPPAITKIRELGAEFQDHFLHNVDIGYKERADNHYFTLATRSGRTIPCQSLA